MYCITITNWLFSLLYLIIVMTGHTTLTLPLPLPLERSHLHDLLQLPNRKVNANIMLFPMVVAITFTIMTHIWGVSVSRTSRCQTPPLLGTHRNRRVTGMVHKSCRAQGLATKADCRVVEQSNCDCLFPVNGLGSVAPLRRLHEPLTASDGRSSST